MKNNNQKGFSVFLAVLIMAIILSVVLGLTILLVGQYKAMRTMGYSVNAFFAAETGAERAMFKVFKTEGPFEHNYTEVLDNGAEYTILVYCCTPGGNCEFEEEGETCPVFDEGNIVEDDSCDATRFCIYSTGSFEGVKRTLEIKVYHPGL